MPVAGTLQCNQVLHSRASSIRSSRTRRALATAPNARVPNASNGELHTSSLAAKHVCIYVNLLIFSSLPMLYSSRTIIFPALSQRSDSAVLRA